MSTSLSEGQKDSFRRLPTKPLLVTNLQILSFVVALSAFVPFFTRNTTRKPRPRSPTMRRCCRKSRRRRSRSIPRRATQ